MAILKFRISKKIHKKCEQAHMIRNILSTRRLIDAIKIRLLVVKNQALLIHDFFQYSHKIIQY